MKNHHLHHKRRLITASLGIVLLVVTVCSIGATVLIWHASDLVSEAVSMNDLYGQAHYLASVEDANVHRYAVNPGSFGAADFRTSARKLEATFRTISHHGDAKDQAVIRSLLRAQQHYVVLSTHFFTLLDAHQTADAFAFEKQTLAPAFAVLDGQVGGAENKDHQLAVQSLHTLQGTEQVVLLCVSLVFLLSLGLLAVFWRALNASQRQIDRAAQEKLLRLESAALADPLTGLFNHRAYQDDVRREVALIARRGEPLVLAMMDIDGLQQINEASGHLEGDRILTTFASILRERHLSDYTYRLSGDAFAMILPQAYLSEAIHAMERLRCAAEQGLCGATISSGIAISDAAAGESDVLQEQAHLAVSEAKRRGHNVVVTFQEIRESVALFAPAKVHAFRRLLREQRLNVAFQPIWDVEQDRLLAFEALARPPAEYGFSGPQEAFDIAEKLGRAHELDALCVHAILARAADVPAEALLFLNLTPQTLDHDLLTGAILLEAVLSAGLTPQRVVLEITERSVVPLEVVVREAKKLRTLGFRLALDDTGAGNAGLEMLSQLPVDFVKIDRAIVVNALTNPSARAILTGITTMAQQMHSYVIAEGIENVEMLTLIQQAGGQAVQGYLLGRPTEIVPSEHRLQALSPSAQRASRDPLAATF